MMMMMTMMIIIKMMRSYHSRGGVQPSTREHGPGHSGLGGQAGVPGRVSLCNGMKPCTNVLTRHVHYDDMIRL